MEVILATAFGRDIKVQEGQGGELYEQAQTVIGSILRDGGGHYSVFLALGGMYIDHLECLILCKLSVCIVCVHDSVVCVYLSVSIYVCIYT